MPFLILCLFLFAVGVVVKLLLRHDARQRLAWEQTRRAQVKDFSVALGRELRDKARGEFDLSAFAERCGVDEEVSDLAAFNLYRDVCDKVMADGVVTDEEEVELNRLAVYLDLDLMEQARMLREAREEYERKAVERKQVRKEMVSDVLTGLASVTPVGKLAPLAVKGGIMAAKMAINAARDGAGKAENPKAETRKRKIRSKVSGVTFVNDDRTKRQDVIRRYCHVGTELKAIPDPKNAYDPEAIGLWISMGRIGKTRRQIGYIRSGLSTEVNDHLRSGGSVSVKVLDVTGGDDGRNLGVNIEINLN